MPRATSDTRSNLDRLRALFWLAATWRTGTTTDLLTVTTTLRPLPQQLCKGLALGLGRTRVGNSRFMVLILALLLVLVLFGAGFAVHLLWIAAVIFAVVWLVGVALGRGEGAGRHRFYRW
jgi:lysylphosphatidylglycerol synthetase-like protein (DUF2156 family)